MRRKEEEGRNRDKVEQEYREKCLSLAKIHPRDAPIRCISSPCTLDDKGRTKWRELLTRGSTVFHKRLAERWAGNKIKFGTERAPKASVHDATSNKRFPRIVGLLPPPRSPFPSSFSFSLQPPSSTSTCLFTTASNLWSSLDSSDGMEAKPKCVSKFGVCIYTKEEEKKEIDSKERERREGRKTPWARIYVCIFHLYTWKILLGRIQALWMIRQLLPRWNRFAWIVQIVFPWFSSTRVNGTKFLVEM